MSNKNYDKYLDMLMRNYPLDSDNSEDLEGGGDLSRDSKTGKIDGTRPFGGFPPIYLCPKDTSVTPEPTTKSREYSTHKTAVSIKDIMKKKRDIGFI
ncbi:MAG: hypothetical protein Hyperionvirus20_12 [Hyperionvirus sp.]|uniref:Uncharacterized protein n=1 Tax=Hyperionvirus sp. TaxID=2487770 RepID=A0A3G5ACB9_9VIRU|nr:MAG: hypothetical protein Hyperionvirus20_12 [Hyperionvirus sp.]